MFTSAFHYNIGRKSENACGNNRGVGAPSPCVFCVLCEKITKLKTKEREEVKNE